MAEYWFCLDCGQEWDEKTGLDGASHMWETGHKVEYYYSGGHT